MVIQAIQILMIIPGIWFVWAGEIPERLLKGKLKDRFPMREDQTRLYGLLLISPLPVSFIVQFILVFMYGAEGLAYIVVAQTVITLLLAFVALIIAARIYEPIEEEPIQADD